MLGNDAFLNTQKPLSIIYSEFKQELESLINRCQLPPFMVCDVLKIYTSNVESMSRDQFQKDLEIYKEQINNRNKLANEQKNASKEK